jgi:hypothetical protein
MIHEGMHAPAIYVHQKNPKIPNIIEYWEKEQYNWE